MARRDVIIISVLVNAALLVILFISAISSNDDKKFEKSLSQEEVLNNDFKEDAIALNEEEKMERVINIEEKKDEDFIAMEEKKNENKIEEEKIMHKLPVLSNIEEVKKVKEILNTDAIDVIVEKGDSLDKIARKHNVKISEIVKLNNLASSFLKVGQKLSIPTAIKNEKKELAKVKEEKKLNEKIIKEDSQKMDPEFYTVRTGDNPYTIAMKHHIKLSTLLKLNELNEKKARKLKPGDKLRIR
jgi:LysM repeat protein